MSLDPSELSALILAAGSGERMGRRPKAFLEAGGATLLERVVEQALGFADEVLVGLRADDLERGRRLLRDEPVTIHAGGATRQITIETLLAASNRPWVLVHDAARPFASPELFAAVISAAAAHAAAIPCLQASRRDAVARREGDCIVGPLSREEVVRTQTPQVVRRDLLIESYRKAHAEGWAEDALGPLLSRAGYRVRIVSGEETNLKVTFPEDWEEARARLQDGRPVAGQNNP